MFKHLKIYEDCMRKRNLKSKETAYLLSSRVNTERLMASVKALKEGKTTTHPITI